MTKRWIAIAVLLMVVGSSAAFADTLGIGLSSGLDENFNSGNTLLSVKLPQFPFLLGLGISGGNPIRAGFTADWWLYTTNLVNFINLYAGPGLYLSLPDPIDVGIRVPVGINAYPIPVLELFFEIAPTIGISLGDRVQFPDPGLQAALGFRFWFDI